MKIGFTGLLTLLFVGCKLGGVIDWSWFWVLSPTLFAIVLALVFMVGAVALAAWVEK